MNEQELQALESLAQDPPSSFPIGWIVGAVIVLGILLMMLSDILKYLKERRQVALQNEQNFKIKARIVFSHQKRSEQPVIIINSRPVALFGFFKNPDELNHWKRWVKQGYEYTQQTDFPILIDGKLK